MSGGGGVRPLERGDVPAVARLLERHAAGGGSSPPAPVEDHVAHTLLDHPWADPELPSLVYADGDGAIVGLLTTYARRLVLDGRPLRMRVGGGYIVDDRHRRRGIGAELVRALVAGPQDLILADGANDAARRHFTALGGRTLEHASIGWRRVLRPAAATSARYVRRGAPVRRTTAALARPLDALLDAVPPVRRRVRPARPATTGEPLTAETMTKLVADSGRRLRPDYDPEFLDWLFAELAPVGPVRTLVRDDAGAPVGWYVYAPGDRAQVLQLGACGPGLTGAVLDHLLADAHARGAAVVEGRMEPDLADVLRTRRATLFPTTWTLVHCADPETHALLASSDGMLSRLDGEWWIGFLLWRAPTTS